MKKSTTNLILATVIVLGGIGIAYYLRFYISPEECVFQEIQELEFDEDSVFNNDEAVKVTSAARTFIQELNLNDLNDNSRRRYIELRAILDKCGVDYKK